MSVSGMAPKSWITDKVLDNVSRRVRRTFIILSLWEYTTFSRPIHFMRDIHILYDLKIEYSQDLDIVLSIDWYKWRQIFYFYVKKIISIIPEISLRSWPKTNCTYRVQTIAILYCKLSLVNIWHWILAERWLYLYTLKHFNRLPARP